MSARLERSALAAIGVDLAAVHGGPGQRRAAALLRRLDGRARDAVALADVADAPAWMRLPAPAQRRLARRVALAALAPALRRSIDGGLLGGHADAAGAETMDWALALPEDEAETESVPAVDGGAQEALGFALMRRALPAGLRPLLGWAETRDDLDCSTPFARRCVGAAVDAKDAA